MSGPRLVSSTLALLLFAPSLEAQTPAAPVFEELARGAMSAARELFAAGQRRAQLERAEVERLHYGPDRAPSLEPESAAATADRLSLAVRTDVSNVEAGVSIAPFTLVGSPHAPGLRLTLASLQDEKVRVGAGYTWDSWRPLLTPTQLGLAACEFDDAQRRRLQAELDDLAPAYEQVCSRLVEPIRAEDLAPDGGQRGKVDRALWTSARTACGLASLDPEATSLALRGPRQGLTLVEALANMRLVVAAAAKRNQGIAASAATLRAAVEELERFQMPLSTECHTTAQIRESFLRRQWSQARWKLGVAASADFFPWRFGFNPEADPSKRLSRGELGRLQLALESSWTRKRVEWAIGVAVNRSRETYLAEQMTTSITPSISFSVAAFGLSGRPLVGENGPQFENGKLPPHAVLGLTARAEILTERPDYQTTSFNSVSIQPFADFKITEKLTVRVAVPVKGEIKERPESKTPAPPRQRSLQWSVPFSIATIVKP